MKKIFSKAQVLAIAMMAVGAAATAQDLNSAYFTQDFKYRHDLNPAFGNDQGYVAIPVLGNINAKLQGNIGVEDLLFQDPATGKYSRTFMHPDVSYEQAMAGFNSGTNKISADIGLTLISVGFKALGGYNTIEVREKTNVGVQLPYELFDFAKNLQNRNYQFGTIGVKATSFAEVALGHSRQITKDLRIGAKLKVLLGAGRAELNIEGMQANLTGNKWMLTSGEAKGEISLKGINIPNKTDEYKNGQSFQKADLGNIDVDGAGIGGFGFGLDLGAVYQIIDGLKVSAAVTDLGFINWNNNILLTQKKGQFEFDGFHDLAVKDANAAPGSTFKEQKNNYADQLTDFVSLQNQGDQGSESKTLAATANVGVEYQLPIYKPLTFGLLGQHHFNGDYSWTEGRLSANWSPLKWLNGGVNVAINNFCTSAGWVLNIHPSGFNFFIGMDHILGKTTKEFVPLSSNANLAVGMNVTF